MEHKRVESENVSDFYYRDNTFFYKITYIYIYIYIYMSLCIQKHIETTQSFTNTFFYKVNKVCVGS